MELGGVLLTVRQFLASKVFRTNPNQLRVPPQADKPKVRLEAPGTINGSVGFYAQLCDCARRVLGQPEVSFVKVWVQEAQNQAGLYFTFTPALAPGDDVYKAKFPTETRSPYFRGLKPLLTEAQITLLEETVYEMDTEIVQDNNGGHMVVASWTSAKALPRPDKVKNTAAGAQEPEK